MKNDEDPAVEWRYYFANGRAIRITGDQKNIPVSSSVELKASQDAMREGLKLKKIFKLGQS